jgi:CheY-like chemotaxis protein
MNPLAAETSERPRPGILLVDDVAANLTAIQAILGDLDADLDTASCGKDALGRLLEREYALVLMDVHMPQMDGLETAEIIRQRDRTNALPVIFLTAYDESIELSSKAYALGAVDYLVKPIVPAVLLAKVGAFLSQYNNRQQVIRQQEELAALRAMHEAELERARELRSYQHYRAISDDSTSEGSQTSYPIDGEVLAGLLKDYHSLVVQYVHAVRLQEARPSAAVRALAARLTELRAGARDIVRLHVGVLDDITRGAFTADRQAISSDARLVLVELLGSVLDLYRGASLKKSTGV